MILDSFAYKNNSHGFQTGQGPLAMGRTISWGNGGYDHVGDYKSMGDNMPSSFIRI